MPAKTGSNSGVVAQIGTTHGTAVAAGAGDKWIVNNINFRRNAEALSEAAVGSGNDMFADSEVGAINPGGSIEWNQRFDGPGVTAEALFFGGRSATAIGAGYLTSVMYNANRTQRFLTVAHDVGDSNSVEYPSCYPSKLTVNITPDAFSTSSMDFVANEQKISGQTNSSAVIAAATSPASTKFVVARQSDIFRINLQGGAALTNSDAVSIQSATIEYSYDLEVVRELKNATGNSAPVASGQPPFATTLTITLKEAADLTWFTAHQAGTEYKADIVITSSYNAAPGLPFAKVYRFPRLKLLSDPDFSLANAGRNPMTLVFTAMVATSVPTGMYSTYPAVMVQHATADVFA